MIELETSTEKKASLEIGYTYLCLEFPAEKERMRNVGIIEKITSQGQAHAGDKYLIWTLRRCLDELSPSETEVGGCLL